MLQIGVILGPCATGKTWLSTELSRILGWPLLAKDNFKEILFNELGSGDLSWSRKLGSASFEIIWHVSEQLCRAGVNHLIEYPCVEPSFLNASLHKLRAKHALDIRLIELTVSPETIVERVQNRLLRGDRHPAHHDERLLDSLRTPVPPFSEHIVANSRLVVDTSDFSKVSTRDLADYFS